MWSTGIVLFAMLASYLPFYFSSANKQELSNKIMEGKYTAPDHLSANAKDIISKCEACFPHSCC